MTKKLRHKHLVKVRSFPEAKIDSMREHVKPTLQEVNSYDIILHASTNDLNTEKRLVKLQNLR